MSFFNMKTYHSISYAGLATLAHWLCFLLLVQLDVQPSLATLMGASFGAALNYILQFYRVFNAKTTHFYSISRYISLVILSIPLNTLIFTLSSQTILPNVMMAQFFTSAIMTLSNLCFYQKVIFHELAH